MEGSTTIPGIPTMRNGVRFRSRLEAKWAGMFDAFGWRWEYEPFDLNGWIPDFAIIGKHPVLVEVKPCYEYRPDVASRCLRAMRDTHAEGHELMIVGATIPEGEPGQIGWFAGGGWLSTEPQFHGQFGADDAQLAHWQELIVLMQQTHPALVSAFKLARLFEFAIDDGRVEVGFNANSFELARAISKRDELEQEMQRLFERTLRFTVREMTTEEEYGCSCGNDDRANCSYPEELAGNRVHCRRLTPDEVADESDDASVLRPCTYSARGGRVYTSPIRTELISHEGWWGGRVHGLHLKGDSLDISHDLVNCIWKDVSNNVQWKAAR